jgi:hypothetical protein
LPKDRYWCVGVDEKGKRHTVLVQYDTLPIWVAHFFKKCAIDNCACPRLDPQIWWTCQTGGYQMREPQSGKVQRAPHDAR